MNPGREQRRVRATTRRRRGPAERGAATEIADRLHSAAIHLLRRLRREDAASGLSPAKASALSVLVFGGPRTIGELAAAEGVRPPSMTQLARALEAERLVTREGDGQDGRVIRLTATELARRLLSEGRSRRVQRLAAAISGLDARGQNILRDAAQLVTEIVKALEPAAEAPPRTARRRERKNGKRISRRSV